MPQTLPTELQLAILALSIPLPTLQNAKQRHQIFLQLSLLCRLWRNGVQHERAKELSRRCDLTWDGDRASDIRRWVTANRSGNGNGGKKFRHRRFEMQVVVQDGAANLREHQVPVHDQPPIRALYAATGEVEELLLQVPGPLVRHLALEKAFPALTHLSLRSNHCMSALLLLNDLPPTLSLSLSYLATSSYTLATDRRFPLPLFNSLTTLILIDTSIRPFRGFFTAFPALRNLAWRDKRRKVQSNWDWADVGVEFEQAPQLRLENLLLEGAWAFAIGSLAEPPRKRFTVVDLRLEERREVEEWCWRRGVPLEVVQKEEGEELDLEEWARLL